MISGTTRRRVLFGGLALSLSAPLPTRLARADSAPADYETAVAAARGQTVYFNAWGGDARINDYIAWAGSEMASRFGVTLQHVKLADTAEAVTKVLGGKAAGQTDGGGVDLIWINGENFAAMKKQNLLFGPIIQLLPNMKFVDPLQKPTVLVDFTVPTDGYESPWGMAQLVFFYDQARLAEPPRTLPALLAWAKAQPGRFTFPAPPDFIGSTILKQFLLMLAPDRAELARPLAPERFDPVTAPLWDYLGQLAPHLWRQGQSYPGTSTILQQLLNDGEIDIAMSFNPGDATSAIAQGLLPVSVRSFVLDGGSIGNTHFVAIPFNANAKAGAIVTANFLLSAEAQAQKANSAVWGDPTVLEMNLLSQSARELFASQASTPATLRPEELGPVLPEPHPSWMTAIEAHWIQLYGR